MSIIVVPKQQSYQPPAARGIDFGNPLTNGLFVCCIPYTRREMCLRKGFTQTGAFTSSASIGGMSLDTNGTNNNISIVIPSTVFTRFSIFGIVRGNSPAVDTRAIALGSSSNSFPIIQLGTDTGVSTKLRLFARDDANTAPTGQAPGSNTPFDGTLNTVATTYDGTTLRSYVNGVQDSSIGVTFTTMTVDRFAVGALARATTTSFCSGSWYLACAHKRCLSPNEVATLSKNPWQLFRSMPTRRPWFQYVAPAVTSVYGLASCGVGR